MNVKRFVAADMRRALELVKMEMGDDAIILSSKRTKAGVEILTSNDTPYEEARHASQLADSFSNYGSVSQQLSAAKNARSVLGSSDEHFSDSVALQSDDAWSWNNVLKQKQAQERGLASGKTRQQLAQEIEVARRKMEAADRVPLSQQATSPLTRRQASDNKSNVTGQAKHSSQFASGPRSNKQSSVDNRPVDNRIEPHFADYSDAEEFDIPAYRSEPPRAREQSKSELPWPLNPTNVLWQAPKDLSNYLIFPAPSNHATSTDTKVSALDEQARADSDLQLQSLKDEISDMRDMLHIQLERLGNSQTVPRQSGNAISLSSAIKATIARRLKQMGMAEGDLNTLIARTKVRAGLAETWTDVLAALAHKLSVWDRNIVKEGGVYAFVGPSGAGKTTVISKLATQYALTRSRPSISIVVLDNPGGHNAALTRLGKILDIPVFNVNDRIGLTRILAERCDDDLVLVDTPNRTIRIGQLSCNDILQRLPQVEKILLLPANAQGKSLQATLTDYQSLQVKACVLTKLDECASLGEVISVILQSQLPLAYFSKGQNIPDDIEIARGHQLVTKAVSLLKKDQVATQRSLIRAPMKNHKSRLIRQSLSA